MFCFPTAVVISSAAKSEIFPSRLGLLKLISFIVQMKYMYDSPHVCTPTFDVMISFIHRDCEHVPTTYDTDPTRNSLTFDVNNIIDICIMFKVLNIGIVLVL